jgi:hypothetical protein
MIADTAWKLLFFSGERTAYLVLTALVGAVAIYGANTLTNSRNAEEAH